jgi:uncharacterized protein (DUF1684 family)
MEEGFSIRVHLLHGSPWPSMVSALGLFAIVAVLVSSCTSGPSAPNAGSYNTEIMASRASKDAMFKTDDQASPIPATERARFAGLAYYPIDPAYRLPALLKDERSGPPFIIELQTSTSAPRRMRRVGTLAFTLNGTPYTLLAFADIDAPSMNRLFVPFGDLTSGHETYGGGRYIELDRTPTGLYDLDFNRAYHPYCLYNPKFECPVPPLENRLLVAIRAGERLAEPKLKN